MRQIGILMLIVVCLAGAMVTAQTSTLYKHVDKDGKVTYSDKPPVKDDLVGKDSKSGKKLEMDNERNVIKSPPKVSNSDQKSSAGKKKADQNQKEENLVAAREAYDAAKQALEDGKEPLENEWQTIGVSKGKPSRVPSEAYHERIRRLEDAVAQASARLRDAERALRE